MASSRLYQLLDTFSRIVESGYLGWLLQRITAIILLLCGAIHIFYITFAVGCMPPSPFILYSLMLTAGVYHALNGLKTILAEWGYGLGKAVNLNILLFVIGALIWIYGISMLYKLYWGI